MSDAGAAQTDSGPLIIGRYALFDALASGGMATVHLGRLLGPIGFQRTVAVKRLHSQYASDQVLVTLFMDEARIVARIRHPNVVPMVDVIETPHGLFLVMEYVHGETYSRLLRLSRANKEVIPLKLVGAIMHGVLLGLHAAHETKGANGEQLDVVHRDVSPQNVMIGVDGVARVLDFGVAKAAGRAQVTREGQIKGKLAYMSPEQIRGKVDRRADVFAAAVMLWESLAGRRLHEGAKDVEIVTRVVQGKFPPPSQYRADVSPEIDAIVARGLHIDPEERYPNAREMALDIERKVGLAPGSEVGAWVERLAIDTLRVRADKATAMEKAAATLAPKESVPPPPQGLTSNPPNQVVDEKTRLMTPDAPPAPSEVSSESGQETRSHTPIGTEVPAYLEPPPPPPKRDLAPMIALFSFFIALALVGIGLGGYSIVMGGKSSAASSSSHAAAPAVSSAPPAPSVSAAPGPSAMASTKPTTGGRDAGAVSSGTPTNPIVAPHSRPAVAPAPSAKKCEPYTVDDAGHKKYNLSCID